MSSSNEIILSNPRGCFYEGFIEGAAYPGMAAEIFPGSSVVGGRLTWKAFGATDATRRLVALFLVDNEQGRTKDDAYADGERCFLYCPVPGEECNVRVDDPAGTGTGSDFSPGTLLKIGQGGLFEETTTASEAVFVVSENAVDLSDDSTVQAIFIGA